MSVVGGENAMDTLQGWFKELYADKEIKLVPDAAWLTKNIPFNKSEAGLGNVYHQPVVLTQEQGFTYAGASAGAFALQSPIAAVLKDAQVQGAQLLLRSQIDYESLARAANTKASFGEASRLLVENMMEAMAKRLELMFLYGRSPTGIGTVNANTTTSATFVVAAAQWAPGLWAGMEGAKIHICTMAGTYPAQTYTRVSASGGATVSSVAFSTRSITIGATISATAGDVIFLYGTIADAASGTISYNEAQGLDSIIEYQDTTLFNINNATYGLFKGNKPSSFAALSVTNILNGLLPAIGKGLMEDVTLLCSNTAFQGLVNPTVDPVAVGASGYNKVGAMLTKTQGESLTLGANSVTIIGAQGRVTVQPHLFVKDKDIFAFPKKGLMRVGATDMTFNTPGAKGGEFFLHRPDNAAYELRCYANQGLFSPVVGKLTKMTLS